MAWKLSSAFDDSDPVSQKDIADGLNDLVFPAPSAANSVLGFQQTASFAQGSVGCTRRIMTLPHTAPTWNPKDPVNSTLTVYNAAVSKIKPQACLRGPNDLNTSHHEDARTYGKIVSGLQLVGGQTGQGFQHLGVTTVRTTLEPSAQSPRKSRCSPAAAPALEAVGDTWGRGDKRVTPKREARSFTPSTDGATHRCMSSGCIRRSSYGFIPDKGGARWCHAHAVAGMEDLHNPKCSSVAQAGGPCHAQPSYGYEGDRRPTRCLAHAEDGMENVRMPGCRHRGCRRQPLYREPGLDKKRTRCHNYALSSVKDVRGGMCCGAGSSCTKRPSYGFRGDPRATRCGSHKELGMEDLISARCKFLGCRTIASYGVQAVGSHVIRRMRCKAHCTLEMTCGTKGPACMAPGGCETRPSYGLPDKFDGEYHPLPERCKKHSLQGMEYTRLAARARKKRVLETAKQEPAPVVSRPPTTARTAAKPLSVAPTRRLRSPRKCAMAAAQVVEPDEDEDLDSVEVQPEDLTRAWPPEIRMQGSPEERTAVVQQREQEDFENLGDLAMVQELKEIEDQANDQMWGRDGPSSTELAYMSEFDRDFSASWGRFESLESGGT